jgi:DnaJ-class molecular chaperone
MPKLHTHYDNLKVARNAPPEVIRAAYKTLCQKFHPDRHLDKERSTKTFQIIHSAYETLSDPVKRSEHDAWIAASEALVQDNKKQTSRQRDLKKTRTGYCHSHTEKLRSNRTRIHNNALWIIILVIIIVAFLFD